MNKQKQVAKRRERRRFHVRKKILGTASQPRLSVQRSLQHIAVQLIDDESGRTLAAVSTRDKAVRGELKYGGNCEAAVAVGKLIAERAQAVGIQAARLDRGHNKYQGRVSALADAAREAGLKF